MHADAVSRARRDANDAAGAPHLVHVSLGRGVYFSSSCCLYTNTSLTLVGNGSAATIIDCEHACRLLLSTGSSLTVAALTVANGAHTVSANNGVNGVRDTGGAAVAVVHCAGDAATTAAAAGVRPRCPHVNDV